MSTSAAVIADPIGTIKQLDPEQILSRISQIERERLALLVLLKAARRAQQGLEPTPSMRKVVADAR